MYFPRVRGHIGRSRTWWENTVQCVGEAEQIEVKFVDNATHARVPLTLFVAQAIEVTTSGLTEHQMGM